MKLMLYPRIYESHGNHSFYLKEVRDLGDGLEYVIEYNTSDGIWDTMYLKDSWYLDSLLIRLHPSSTQVAASLVIESNEYNALKPGNSTIIMLGRYLQNRTLFNHRFSLDSSHGEWIKLDVGSQTLNLSLGDLVYHEGMQVGVLDTRVRGGYVLLHILNDTLEFRDFGGLRYCAKEYRRFGEGRPFTLSKDSTVRLSGVDVSLISVSDSYVMVHFMGGGYDLSLPLTCAAEIDLFESKLSLIWLGSGHEGTAKIVVHS